MIVKCTNQECNIDNIYGKYLVVIDSYDKHAKYLYEALLIYPPLYIDVVNFDNNLKITFNIRYDPTFFTVESGKLSTVFVNPSDRDYLGIDEFGNVRFIPFPDGTLGVLDEEDINPGYLADKIEASLPLYIDMSNDLFEINLANVAHSITIIDGKITLVGSSGSVPPFHYYGTDEKGNRGWIPIPPVDKVRVSDYDFEDGYLEEKIVGRYGIEVKTIDNDYLLVSVAVGGSLVINDEGKISLAGFTGDVPPLSYYGTDFLGNKGFYTFDVNLDKRIMVTVSDLKSGYLSEKIVAGQNISLDIVEKSEEEKAIVINVRGIANETVKISEIDSRPGYLVEKLFIGQCINFRIETDDEHNQVIYVDLTNPCLKDDIYVKVSKADSSSGFLSDKIMTLPPLFYDIEISEDIQRLKFYLRAAKSLYEGDCLSLVNDTFYCTNQYYGTNDEGVKGWWDLPSPYKVSLWISGPDLPICDTDEYHIESCTDDEIDCYLRDTCYDKVTPNIAREGTLDQLIKVREDDPLKISVINRSGVRTLRLSVRTSKSVVIDNDAIQLFNDVDKTMSSAYGTDPNANRGWVGLPPRGYITVLYDTNELPGFLQDKLVPGTAISIYDVYMYTGSVLFVDLKVSMSVMVDPNTKELKLVGDQVEVGDRDVYSSGIDGVKQWFDFTEYVLQMKINDLDPSPDYLDNKLTAGPGIRIYRYGENNEKLVLDTDWEKIRTEFFSIHYEPICCHVGSSHHYLIYDDHFIVGNWQLHNDITLRFASAKNYAVYSIIGITYDPAVYPDGADFDPMGDRWGFYFVHWWCDLTNLFWSKGTCECLPEYEHYLHLCNYNDNDDDAPEKVSNYNLARVCSCILCPDRAAKVVEEDIRAGSLLEKITGRYGIYSILDEERRIIGTNIYMTVFPYRYYKFRGYQWFILDYDPGTGDGGCLRPIELPEEISLDLIVIVDLYDYTLSTAVMIYSAIAAFLSELPEQYFSGDIRLTVATVDKNGANIILQSRLHQQLIAYMLSTLFDLKLVPASEERTHISTLFAFLMNNFREDVPKYVFTFIKSFDYGLDDRDTVEELRNNNFKLKYFVSGLSDVSDLVYSISHLMNCDVDDSECQMGLNYDVIFCRNMNSVFLKNWMIYAVVNGLGEICPSLPPSPSESPSSPIESPSQPASSPSQPASSPAESPSQPASSPSQSTSSPTESPSQSPPSPSQPVSSPSLIDDNKEDAPYTQFTSPRGIFIFDLSVDGDVYSSDYSGDEIYFLVGDRQVFPEVLSDTLEVGLSYDMRSISLVRISNCHFLNLSIGRYYRYYVGMKDDQSIMVVKNQYTDSTFAVTFTYGQKSTFLKVFPFYGTNWYFAGQLIDDQSEPYLYVLVVSKSDVSQNSLFLIRPPVSSATILDATFDNANSYMYILAKDDNDNRIYLYRIHIQGLTGFTYDTREIYGILSDEIDSAYLALDPNNPSQFFITISYLNKVVQLKVDTSLSILDALVLEVNNPPGRSTFQDGLFVGYKSSDDTLSIVRSDIFPGLTQYASHNFSITGGTNLLPLRTYNYSIGYGYYVWNAFRGNNFLAIVQMDPELGPEDGQYSYSDFCSDYGLDELMYQMSYPPSPIDYNIVITSTAVTVQTLSNVNVSLINDVTDITFEPITSTSICSYQ